MYVLKTLTNAALCSIMDLIHMKGEVLLMKKTYGEVLCHIDEHATLYRLQRDIYKLDTPPVTSLFFVRGDGAWYIIDAGEDLPNSRARIAAVMEHLGIASGDVKAILLTHDHWDHTDGLPHLLALCPEAAIYGAAEENKRAGSRYKRIDDGDEIGGIFRAVRLYGHAPDMLAYLDMRTRSLFSGDGIQLYGVAWAGMFIFEGIGIYLDSMRRLLTMDIDCIFSSHAYVPLGAFAVGVDAVREYLETAIRCVEELTRSTLEMYDGGERDADAIKAAFIEKGKALYPDFPTDGFVDAIRGILREYR